jgi:hypothetical protein
MCRDDTFVQASALKLIAKHPKKPAHVICYVCFRRFSRELRKKVAENAVTLPECKAELEMMKRSGEEWWENK